ncbi:MAG: hypothetical protein NZ872_06660, partial [Archaeoglobaceae archaeon]|nr:hypothetical protein [Archaeoglobaceae archaeon]MDW8128880.1 hypothetical protein [Archaeoglobaceae archaeon]
DTDGNNLWETPADFSANLNMMISSVGANAKLEILCVNTSSNEIEVLNIESFNKTPTPNAVRVSRFVIASNSELPCLGAKVVEVRLTLWR